MPVRSSARATRSRRNIIGGLERLGGFGGVADRLNCYNHYLGTPDYLQQDIERYRAVTPPSLQAFAQRSADAERARRRARRARASRSAVAQVPTPPAPGGGQAQAANRSTPTSRGATRCRKPVTARPLQLATPASATLPNGLTLILSERRGLPIVAANLVLRDRQRRESARQAGAGQLRRRDARRRHGHAQRAADRRRSRAARRVAGHRAARWTRRPSRRDR